MDNHTDGPPAPRTSSDPRPPNQEPVPATGMRILDARHTHIGGIPMLLVLVDRIPALDELTFRAVDLEPDPRNNPATLYVGVHPDGYVTHLVNTADGPSRTGNTVQLRMDDGTIRDIVDPYRSDDALISWYVPDLDVRADVGLIADRTEYLRHQDGRGVSPAALRPAAADIALRLADSHPIDDGTASPHFGRTVDSRTASMGPTALRPDEASRACVPMRILAARRHMTADGNVQLTVLVDRVPRIDELTFRAIDVGRVRPVPVMVLYVGVHPDGYVVPLVDIGDGRGFYGQTFHLRMDDGTILRVVGPYPAPGDLVRVFARDMHIRTDIGLLDDPDTFASHRDGRGALPACLTAAAADTALQLAIARGLAERGEPTRVFADIDVDVLDDRGQR